MIRRIDDSYRKRKTCVALEVGTLLTNSRDKGGERLPPLPVRPLPLLSIFPSLSSGPRA